MENLCSIIFLLAFGILQIYSHPIENGRYCQPDTVLDVLERIKRDKIMNEDAKKEADRRVAERHLIRDLAAQQDRQRAQRLFNADSLALRNMAQGYQNQGMSERDAMERARRENPRLAASVDNYNRNQG